MKLCQDDLSAYASAAALLAIHSAISYSDAVLIDLSGVRPRSDNHLDAVQKLKRACRSAQLDQHGISHFQRLLGAKTEISYGDKSVGHEKTMALCIAAERFQAWAERILQGRGGT
jgi:hypothetical protein